MHNSQTLTRLGGTAIAAVLALTATPALAQEATPQEVPQITVPDEPQSTTTTTTTTTTTSEPVATTDPLAAAPAAETTTEKKTVTTTRKATSKPAPKATTAAAAARAAAPTAAPVAEAAPAPAPLTEAPVAPLAAAPLAAPTPAPVAEPTPTAIESGDMTLPIALGAGLGLLVLGGAGIALSRRRRRDAVIEDTIVAEPTISRDYTPQPAPAMATQRSAFSWGTTAPAAATAAAAKGSWIERAKRGPTPENPFLSLKKRLQRAAFFEQRERAVAAGKAQSLSPMAGLPQRFAEAIRSRPAMPTTTGGYIHAYA